MVNGVLSLEPQGTRAPGLWGHVRGSSSEPVSFTPKDLKYHDGTCIDPKVGLQELLQGPGIYHKDTGTLWDTSSSTCECFGVAVRQVEAEIQATGFRSARVVRLVQNQGPLSLPETLKPQPGIHIYIYTCIHIHTYVCTYIHVHIYIRTYIHIHAYVYVYIVFMCTDRKRQLHTCS